MERKLLNISDPAVIALHAVVELAKSKKSMTAKVISQKWEIPHPHLSKVLRKLVVADILVSEKGPLGGFTLNPAKKDISFKDILIAVDGKIIFSNCFFCKKTCLHRNQSRECVFGNLSKKINDTFEKFSNTKIRKA